MRYTDAPELDAVYGLIAALYERDDRPADAMTITAALAMLGEGRATEDPFDTAISGLGLSRAYVTEELEALGLLT